MSFKPKLLHPNEDVLLDSRPHWVRLVPTSLAALAILAPCVAGFVLWTKAPIWFAWLLLAIIGVDAMFVTARILRWHSTSLVITNHRVIYRSGVLSRFGRELRLDAVQAVTYHQSLIERMVGAGSVVFTTAGDGADTRIPDVRAPARVLSLLNDAAASARPRTVEREPQPIPAAAEPDRNTELRRLSDLHRRGVITAIELERARQNLVGY